ncbi:MAG TPA: HyaD/HybD family hydrogenase maturation endopeptidase [Thermoanaerobaculia bacterium]|jgi:hydrogenase maturation protease
MNDERHPLLILGLGNVLCADDGVGVTAVTRLLESWEPPEGVRVMDGGTLGLALLPYLQDARRVLIVDAVRADAPPGSPVRLEGDEVAPAVAARLSPHQVGVADLLDGARWLGTYPEVVVLLGVVPATIELGLARTPAVEAAIPDLVSRVLAEAALFGFRFQPRGNEEVFDSGVRAGPIRAALL